MGSKKRKHQGDAIVLAGNGVNGVTYAGKGAGKGAAAGASSTAPAAPSESSSLTRDEVLALLKPYSRDELAGAVADTLSVAVVRRLADADLNKRKLFVRNLSPSTTSDTLCAAFSHFGDIVDAAAIKGRGFGFVTFAHTDSAVLAARNRHMTIDGKSASVHFASAQNNSEVPPNANENSVDAGAATTAFPAEGLRKIYVSNVPDTMPPETLRKVFGIYGEIEAGPFGYDKDTGKSRGYALILFRTVEAAQAALAEPMKTVGGHHMFVKLAESKKTVQPKIPPAAAPANTVAPPSTSVAMVAAGTNAVSAQRQILDDSVKLSAGRYGAAESVNEIYSTFPGAVSSGVGFGQYQLSSVASEMLGLTTFGGVGSSSTSGMVLGGTGIGRAAVDVSGQGGQAVGAPGFTGPALGGPGHGGTALGGSGLGGTAIGGSVFGGTALGGPGLSGLPLGALAGGAALGSSGLVGASLGSSEFGGSALGGSRLSGAVSTASGIGAIGVGGHYGLQPASQLGTIGGLGGLGSFGGLSSTGQGIGLSSYGLQNQGLGAIPAGSFAETAARYSLSGSGSTAAYQAKLQPQAGSPIGTRSGAGLYPTLPPSYL